MPRPLSLAALSLIDCSPPELITIAAGAGFDHVGLRLLPARPGDIGPPMLGDTKMRREVLRRMEDTGIHVLDIEVIWLRPGLQPKDYERFFETGAILGARRVLVAGGDAEEGRMADSLAALCDLAAPYGLALDLEFIPWTPLKDLDMALRILIRAGRVNAGVLIDCLHAARAGATPEEMAGIDPARLGYVQLCDAPATAPADLMQEARSARLAPGDGGLPLREVLAALPVDLAISVETPLAAPGLTAAEKAGHLYRAARRVLED